MNSMHLALVTRRFWPLVGGAEVVMANLASAFRQLGEDCLILTARWESHWPRDIVHREVPVVRLANPRQRGWGTLRYMLALNRWLRTHRDSIDLVYVSMLKHDAYAALGALSRSPIPVVLRAEGAGETGDCRWQEEARFGHRIRQRCRMADALIAPSEAIERELLAAGYPADRVHYLPNGVAVPPPADPGRRRQARQALQDVNFDLTTAPGAPVAVYTGRLHGAKGLAELVQAWSEVIRRWPEARLWLVGEGPLREDLYQLVGDLDLRGRVLLPGAFDDVEEVLQAANLFVLPSHEEGMSISLLEAMAAGLPVVATDIPGNRKLIQDGQHGILVPARQPPRLAEAILRVLASPELAARLGQAARRRVEQEYSLAEAAQRHLELFHELIERKRSAFARAGG